MNPAQQQADQIGGRLTRCAGSLLSLLIVLRRSKDLDSFSDLRPTIDRVFSDFRNLARDEKVSGEEIDDASYALAAAFDEALLSASWDGKEAWHKDSLAKKYCHDEFVGDGFYDKLAEVRRASPPKREASEVFYYCLVAGFHGRLIDSPQKRDDLISELAQEIGTPVKVLAPAGLPELGGGKLHPIRRFPWPTVALFCILIPFLVWLVSWHALDKYARTIVNALGG